MTGTFLEELDEQNQEVEFRELMTNSVWYVLQMCIRDSVAGAVFGIYNTDDLKNAKGEIIVKAETLLQEMTSDNDCLAACTRDLPLGQYYVKELKAPAGFVSSDEVLNLDASYQGKDVKTVKPVSYTHLGRRNRY